MNKRGFTLIEIMVSVVIISILMSLSFVAFSASRKSARDGRRKADLEQIRSALEMYRSDCHEYPSSIEGSITGPVSCGSVVYMETVPVDPSPSSYSYSYSLTNSNQYVLCAYLENGGTTVVGCGSCTATCNYKLTNP
jgi:general secretion pathway protein G